MRRPSPALVLAAIALFVALGGPAQAKKLLNGSKIKKNSITTKQLKDGTIAERDLAATITAKLGAIGTVADNSVTSLKIADGSVTEADLPPALVADFRAVPPLADGAVATAKLADNAVTAAKLADNAVDSSAIRDGVATGRDVGRFAGTLQDLDFGQDVDEGICKTVTTSSQTSILSGQDLRDDVIMVTPTQVPDGLSLYATAAGADLIAVTLCNVDGGAALDIGALDFRYLTIDVGGA